MHCPPGNTWDRAPKLSLRNTTDLPWCPFLNCLLLVVLCASCLLVSYLKLLSNSILVLLSCEKTHLSILTPRNGLSIKTGLTLKCVCDGFLLQLHLFPFPFCLNILLISFLKTKQNSYHFKSLMGSHHRREQSLGPTQKHPVTWPGGWWRTTP